MKKYSTVPANAGIYTFIFSVLLLLLPIGAFAEDQPGGTAPETAPGTEAPGTTAPGPAEPVAAEPRADLPAWQGGQYRWFTEDFIPAQHFTLQPEMFFYAGYRFVGLDGKRRAAEYDYLHSSFAGGLSVHEYPLPFMVDIDADYLNENDHNVTADIAFTDILKIKIQSTELFHNMDHYRFMDPSSTDTDPGAQYGVDVNINSAKIILKTPFVPFHAYVDLREFSKEGLVQQRFSTDLFTGGKASRSRSIDWVTDELTAGLNGNLFTLLEVDYHHTIKHFEPKRDSFLMDVLEGGALLAHNLTPKLESNYDTLSLHTDQSKPLTLAGTATYVRKDNKFSQALVKSHREYGDLTYRITNSLTFSAKYGHQRIQADNPDVLTRGLPFNVATPVEVVNSLITRTADRGVLSLAYQPLRAVNVTAQYSIDAMERTNDTVWSQPESLNITKSNSVKHVGKLAVLLEPMRHTKLRLSASYTANSNPSYIVDYRQAWEGVAWASVVPMPGLVLNADYKILRGYNPAQNWRTNDEALDNLNRHVWRDDAGAGVTWFALKGLTLGAHYDYIRNKIKQNIFFEDIAGNEVFAFNQPWWDTSHGYTVFGRFCFPFPLTLQADFSQNWAKSLFKLDQILSGPPPAALVDTTIIPDETRQRIRDTRLNVKADYEVYKGWGVSLAYGLSQYRDLTRPQVVEDRDGTAHFGAAYLTKKWL